MCLNFLWWCKDPVNSIKEPSHLTPSSSEVENSSVTRSSSMSLSDWWHSSLLDPSSSYLDLPVPSLISFSHVFCKRKSHFITCLHLIDLTLFFLCNALSFSRSRLKILKISLEKENHKKKEKKYKLMCFFLEKKIKLPFNYTALLQSSHDTHVLVATIFETMAGYLKKLECTKKNWSFLFTCEQTFSINFYARTNFFHQFWS